MVEVGVLEAKTRLSQLLQAALDGEDVVITRHGKQIAKLTPIPQPRRPAPDVAERALRLRERFTREAPNPGAADIDGDLARMRRGD